MPCTHHALRPVAEGRLAALPIDGHLDAVRRELRGRSSLVVAAPPGTGKTTRVAPAIAELDAVTGRVVLLEPRRLAAIAAASRIAEERGTALGEEIGYQVRFERRWSESTRLVAATEGTLLQWLLQDPLLEDVGCIVFDEVHERSLSTDLALAMALRVREVRDELRLVAMSATLDADRFAELLGDAKGPSPVVGCETVGHPVDVRYAPRPDERPLERRVQAAIRRALRETAGSEAGGSVLAFLPGVGEIERCRERLEGTVDVPALPLHGSLPLERQRAALRGGRRVVLATNVAESSVTVEGIGAVVDAGLERILRFDSASGLDRLELVAISRASADQRAGRAGRAGPGVCLRLWTESEQGARVLERRPEIQRVDLASAVLTLRAWGEDPSTLRWPDPPSGAQIAQAQALLIELGALTEDCAITSRGRRMVGLPLHPRLAALVLNAAERERTEEGALLASLLAERDPFQRPRPGEAEGLSDLRSDLLDRWLALSGAPRGRRDGRLHRGAARRVERAAEQIAAALGGCWKGLDALRRDPGTQETMLRSLLVAYPDRVARRREPRSPRAVMVGGHGVRLGPGSRVRSEPLFVCLSIGGARGGGAWGGGRETVVHSASAVEESWLDTRVEEAAELDASGRVILRRRRLYGDLVLDEVEVGSASPDQAAPLLERWALADLRSALGLDRSEIVRFRARLACVREWRPELELPDLSLPAPEAAIQAVAEEGAGEATDPLAPVWRDVLQAAIAGSRSTADVEGAPVLDLLRGSLTWGQLQQLDELAPERLELPNGRTAAIEYAPGRPPVLAARIQDLFGWRQTPRIGGGRVPLLLHLLAPNFRPQQVTDDLAGFWERTYPEVRKELAGRYPKHAWPEDGATASPVRGRGRPR